ncbi:phosphodiester glycosidase family protein [Paenibacillus sp. strain BS8-2]
MTTATYSQTTWNGNTVKCIEADVSSVSVDAIAGTVMSSGKFGVNGTFFSGSTLLGIAIKNNSAVGSSGTGTINGTASKVLNRGTFYRLNVYGTNSTTAAVVHHFRDDLSIPPYPNGQVTWAIGGLSLFLNEGDSFQSFYQKLDVNEKASGVNDVIAKEGILYVSPNNRPRTAIGLLPNGKIFLCVFANETPWYMKAFLEFKGCTKGIYLDGGGSSQMRYKTSNGQMLNWDPSNDARPTKTMVSVNPTSWT